MSVTELRSSWQTLPRAAYNGEHDKPETYSDPTFFNKSSVHNGTRFVHYNRRAHATTWVVDEIWTITGTARNRVKSRIYSVRTLSDRVSMRCEETGERRTLSFVYLVYSAIWRISA